MISDTPMLYIGDLWKKVLYGDQPAGWDIAGSKENIAKITRAQIVDYMRSQYVAANTIVCVAGNIREDYAVGIVKKYFSKIKTAKFGNKAPVIEKQISPQVLILPKETDQTHLALGVRAYNIFHVDKYVLDLLETILGGMMSSRLFLEVREKFGAAYYIKTNVESDPDTGYLSTFAGIDNRKLDKAILTILREYKKISQQKINLDELKKAKDNIKGKLALTLESSDAQAFFYAGQEILEKNILTPAEICKRIDKVTANDILKVAKDIFRPEKLNLALIGPFEDKSRFIKLLKF